MRQSHAVPLLLIPSLAPTGAWVGEHQDTGHGDDARAVTSAIVAAYVVLDH